MEGRFAFFDGSIVPIEEAQISVRTHALNYGTGCFEGIRGYWSDDDQQMYVFQLREHYERFLRSCKLLFIELLHSAGELSEITLELLRGEERRQPRRDARVQRHHGARLGGGAVSGGGLGARSHAW